MNCRYCGVSIVDPHHPWPPNKCTECQISDSHDSDEKIQRIDRLRRDKARLMKFIRNLRYLVGWCGSCPVDDDICDANGTCAAKINRKIWKVMK